MGILLAVKRNHALKPPPDMGQDMGDADAVLLEMLKGLRHDVATIRDNHLAHIAEDIENIKTEQIETRRDIDDLMEFKTELQGQIGTAVNRILLIALTAVTASLGVPMAL
tara:strand:+ start:1787 stop:2116 length:330 start_codon:yes stop_codon:yes gene_type:complete